MSADHTNGPKKTPNPLITKELSPALEKKNEPSTKEKQKHDSAVFMTTREVGNARQNLATYQYKQLMTDLKLDTASAKNI